MYDMPPVHEMGMCVVAVTRPRCTPMTAVASFQVEAGG
jgi:hypothetical protein